jgi:hypothetical protein
VLVRIYTTFRIPGRVAFKDASDPCLGLRQMFMLSAVSMIPRGSAPRRRLRAAVWGSELGSAGSGRGDLSVSQLVVTALGSQVRDAELDTRFRPNIVSFGTCLHVVPNAGSQPIDAAVEVDFPLSMFESFSA